MAQGARFLSVNLQVLKKTRRKPEKAISLRCFLSFRFRDCADGCLCGRPVRVKTGEFELTPLFLLKRAISINSLRATGTETASRFFRFRQANDCGPETFPVEIGTLRPDGF